MILFLIALVGALQERHEVPSSEAFKRAEKEVRETYSVKDASPDLARKLMEDAMGTGGEPASRYALLMVAVDVASAASDVRLAFRAVDLLEKSFRMTGEKLRSRAVTVAKASCSSPQAHRTCASGLYQVAEDYLKVADFDGASKLAKDAATHAKAGSYPFLATKSAQLASDIPAIKRIREKGVKAQEAIEKGAQEPSMLTDLGTHLLVTGSVADAVPLLARGLPGALATAAQADGDVGERAGDLWWSAWEGQAKSPVGRACRALALNLYRTLMPELSGIARAKAEKRLRDAWEADGLSPVGDWMVEHAGWPTPQKLTVSADGTHVTIQAGFSMRGKWTFDGVTFLLIWDRFPPEPWRLELNGQLVNAGGRFKVTATRL
jgi:hypothetical protein